MVQLTGASKNPAAKEKTARKQNEFFNFAMAPGLFATVLKRADGSYTMPFVSECVRDLCGLDPEDVMRDIRVFAALVHPDDIAMISRKADESARDLTPCSVEYRISHPDKGMRWIEHSSMPQRLPDGSTRWEGFFRDISERKRIEDELKLKELVIEHAHDALYLMDQENFVYANEAACRSLGYSRDELLALTLKDIDPDFSAEEEKQAALNKLLEEGSIIHETRHYRRDGSSFPVEIQASLFDYQGKMLVLSVARDITERKRMEQALIDSEQKFRSLAENVPDNIARWDTKTRYIYVNSACERTLDTAAANVIGKTINEAFPDGRFAQIATAIAQIVATGETITVVRQPAQFANGERQLHDVTMAPERDAAGKIIGVLGVGRDMTGFYHLQDNLHHSQEMLSDAQKLALLGSWDWDVVTNRVEWSEMAYKIYTPDKRPDEPGFEDFKSSIHADDLERVVAAVQAAFEHDTPFDLDHRVVSVSKGVRTVHAQGKVFRDALGKPARMVGTVQDITGRKRTEDLLKFIAQGEWLKSNDNFLTALASYLGKDLGLDYVMVDKLAADPSYAETVAIYAKGAVVPNMQYSLQYTPCENVLNRGLCCYPENVQQHFPKDVLLAEMQVESYAGIPLRDSKGKVIGLIAMMDGKPMRDTNLLTSILQQVATRAAIALERQQIEQSLKDSRDFLNSVIDGIADPIFVKDRDHHWLVANDAFCSLIGQPREKLIGKSDYDFLPKEQSDVFWEKDELVFSSGETNINEETITGTSGETRYIQTKKTPFTIAGEQRLMVGVIRDITERKRHEDELRLAAAVYENSSEGMLITDADTKIVAINPAFTELTGYSIDDVIGKTPGMFQSGRHSKEFYQDMWSQLTHQGRWQGELWNRRKDGSIYAEHLNINAEINADGSVHRYVALCSDITDKKKKDELIWKQASYDSLTGLPNRRLFHDRLEQEAKMSLRTGSSMGLLFIDLDRFKEVNDTLGHAKGDALLIEVTKRIRRCVRETDTVARLGGDEFTVIVPGVTEAINLDHIVQNILHELFTPFDLGEGDQGHISASIGIALFPDDTNKLEELMQFADQAMYKAKLSGRNRSSYFKIDNASQCAGNNAVKND